jgi:spore maturation protein CgeB
MRLFRLSTAYDTYLAGFYTSRPGLAVLPYAQQREDLDRDAFGWGDAWGRALAPLGWETMEVYANAEPLLRAWALEHAPSVAHARPLAIVRAQLEAFRPDVLWYDYHDESFLREARAAVPSIRLAVGWVGSSVEGGGLWGSLDLVLSCARESLAALKARGVRGELLHHAFDERILGRLVERPAAHALTFVGQIAHDHPFHIHRERLLEALLRETDVTIFSPSGEDSARHSTGNRVRQILYDAMATLRAMGVGDGVLRRLPLIGRATRWPARPRGPLSPRLRGAIRPARFGLEMFQTLRDSKLTLDSSPESASNMRLFEATGVGTCLLTDWKPDLGELFEPEREVATYRDAGECLEKIRWLLAHDAERQAIARAGQARTLAQHTFPHRARHLDAILRGACA